MNILYKSGDLFDIAAQKEFQSYALAHCISEDCVMGKGIAVQFKKRFGGVSDLKKQVSQGKKTGKCCLLERQKKTVYYLITKKTWRNKPTYVSLRDSLEDMKTSIVSLNLQGICMPKIGCGLDRLEWTKVVDIIREVFATTNLTIVICSL